jgi:fatty-acyl-CoA synthase
MAKTFDHANLIEALDASKGWTDRGFTFLDRDQKEFFCSFDDLRTQAMRRAAHFRRAGLKQGDRLAMVLPDGEDFVPTFLAAVWAGLVPVPLYPPLSLGKLDAYLESLSSILNKAEPAFVVTNAKLQQVLWSGLTRVKSLHGVLTAEELRGDPPAGISQDPAKVSASDLCFLQFTSGSTSAPKGVAVTHANLRANALAIIRDGLRADPDQDRGVSWLPLYHDMGLIGFVIAPMLHRIPVTFIPTMTFVRNPTVWLETLHRVKGTLTFAPNFAYALSVKRAKPEQLARWDLSSVRVFGCGAEPINPTTLRAFFETFAKSGVRPTSALPCYGMAEATLAISFIALEERLTTDVVDASAYQQQRAAVPTRADGLAAHITQEFVNCGKAFPEHEIGIFGDDGHRLGDRRIGEIRVRGPSVATGYYRDADATARTFGDGWLKTGDYGYLVQGDVFITGRKKDIIIINGRNYDPQRIEWLVDDLPEVRKGSTVAFSRPGAASEELVLALETRTENPEPLKDAIRQKVMEHTQLAVTDIALCSIGSLPKTSSGKLQRAKTRDQYLAGTVGKEGNRSLGSGAVKLVLARHVALSMLGRSRHRARRIISHTLEIRSLGDVVHKFKLASSYLQQRVNRIFA